MRQPKAEVCFSPPHLPPRQQQNEQATPSKMPGVLDVSPGTVMDTDQLCIAGTHEPAPPLPRHWLISRGQGHQCEKFLLEIFSRCDWQCDNAMGDFCCCSVKKKLLQLIACRKSFIKSRNCYNFFKLQCRLLKHF